MTSPDETYRNFSAIKKTLGIKKIEDVAKISKVMNYFYLLLLLYPFIIVYLLYYFKPDIVCDKHVLDDIYLDEDEYRPKRKKVSISKLILCFIAFQIPLFLYYFFMKE